MFAGSSAFSKTHDLNQFPYDYPVKVRNRFKGLDLIDRVPDELWNEVRDIVQETGIKTIPMEKKCKKAKWLYGEAIQIAVKRREVKSKGEKERYKHLNAEFQKIARRDKKAFPSDQCKEIEENNRLGKTRDLFKKIRDTKGTLHVKMGSIEDRNGMALTEAEDIKKRWQEYTEKLYKKDLHDPDNHDGVITYLELDILECEVKWALESITTELTELTESLSCLLSHLTLCNPMDCSPPGLQVGFLRQESCSKMGFLRQEYWSGLPFFLQGIFMTQGWNPCLLQLLP